MILITLNGKKLSLEPNTTLKAVLMKIENLLDPFAVALNRNFVSRDDYSKVLLEEGDEIEIVIPMQGG
jgi:sulfur carrier protein